MSSSLIRLFQCGLDELNRVCHVYMFPDSDDSPSQRMKRCVGLFVALSVSGDLAFPPASIRSHVCAMAWTPMPEAAIDKDGHSASRESYVDCSPRKTGDAIGNSIAVPACIQR